MTSTISSTLSSPTYSATSLPISCKQLLRQVITGVLQAKDSKIGKPNPSEREGYIVKVAPLYKERRYSSDTYLRKTILRSDISFAYVCNMS